MAGRQIDISTETTEVALVAATIKTVLEFTAPANVGVVIIGWGIFFDGVSVTAEPVKLSIAVKSVAGTGTAVTVRDMPDEDRTGTIQTVARVNMSVEGTVTYDSEARNIHPQQGFEIWYPEGCRPRSIAGGIMGIRANAPAAVNCNSFMRLEE